MTTLLFVDADNQSSELVPALARFLGAINRVCGRAVVAGNGAGDQVRGWQRALDAAIPGIGVACHVAPARKQSADVRLMFELAPLYHREPDPAALLVIVSRDELFLAAGECLVERGYSAIVAVGAPSGGCAPVTGVPVVLLSSPQSSVQASALIPAKPVPAPAGCPPPQVDRNVLSAAIEKIRHSLNANSQGGYAASAVGQVLAQLGHDKAMRTRIVASIPNLREIGAGSEKRLIF